MTIVGGRVLSRWCLCFWNLLPGRLIFDAFDAIILLPLNPAFGMAHRCGMERRAFVARHHPPRDHIHMSSSYDSSLTTVSAHCLRDVERGMTGTA